MQWPLPPWHKLRSGAASGRYCAWRWQQHLASMADAAREGLRDRRKKDLRALREVARELSAESHHKEMIRMSRNGELTIASRESRGRIERNVQKEAYQTRVAFGGVEAGGPGPDWGKVIVDLGKERDELKNKLENSEKEVKRLNQVNFELVKAQRDAALADESEDDDAAAETFQSAEEFTNNILDLPGETDLQYAERTFDLLWVKYEGAVRMYSEAEDSRIRADNKAAKAQDDLKEAQNEAKKDIASLNEALLNEVRAQRDAALSTSLDVSSFESARRRLLNELRAHLDDGRREPVAALLACPSPPI